MDRNSRSLGVLKSLPSAGFWIVFSFGALLLVCGSTATVLEFRYYRVVFSKDLLILLAIIGLGMLLTSLAFLCESPGRFQRVFLIARNSFIALIAISIALLFLLTLFGNWLPIPVQSVLFVTVLLLGLTMIVAGWRSWISSRRTEDVPRWRKGVGLVGLTSNTLLAIPLASLLYRMHYPFLRAAVTGLSMADVHKIVTTSLVLSSSALIAGVFAAPRCRFAILLGSFIFGSVVLCIPVGFA